MKFVIPSYQRSEILQQKTLKYLDTNYCDYYKRIKSPNTPHTFGAYKKIQEDTRNWKFHKNF